MKALVDVLSLLPDVTTADPSVVAGAINRVGAVPVALALLSRLSPSGTLAAIATSNTDLDAELDAFDAHEAALRKLQEPGLIDRLETDFALCVPALADAAVPLEAWAIPLLSALVGPCAPLLSFGLTLACKIAIAALRSWASRRIANQKGITS